MNIREYLNNNPAVVTIAAVVVLVICLALIVMQLAGGGSSGPVEVWYYDTGAKQLVVAESDENPPLPSDSGGELVRAYLFACGSCDDKIGDIDAGMTPAETSAAGVYVVYVEKFTADAKAKMDAAIENPEAQVGDEYMDLEAGLRYALVNDDGSVSEWVEQYPMTEQEPENTWEQMQNDRLTSLCPGNDPRPCPRPR